MKTLVSYTISNDNAYHIANMFVQEENEDGELLGFNVIATKLLGIVTAPIHTALTTKLLQVCLLQCHVTCHMRIM